MDNGMRAAVSSTADERWAAWIAKGVAQDRKTKSRAIGVAAIIVCGFGLWATALLLG